MIELNEIDKQVIKEYHDQIIEHPIAPKSVVGPLTNTAMNRSPEGVSFWDIGKQLQFTPGNHGKIEFRCQDEVVAGYWHWLRSSLIDS